MGRFTEGDYEYGKAAYEAFYTYMGGEKLRGLSLLHGKDWSRW